MLEKEFIQNENQIIMFVSNSFLLYMLYYPRVRGEAGNIIIVIDATIYYAAPAAANCAAPAAVANSTTSVDNILCKPPSQHTVSGII